MENTDGVHHLRSSGSGLPVAAAEPLGEAVIQESFIKRVRFVEWQSALLLEELEKLNATLAEAEKEWER